MSDLTRSLLDLIGPELRRMVDAAVEARTPKPSPWFTTKAAGEYLDITPQAVRQRVYSGTLKAHRDSGGKMRFHRDDLDASMAEW